jgi:hypothetical protein
VEFTADQALAAAAAARRDGGALKEAKEFLRDFLTDGPADASEGENAAKAHGISESTLKRARKTLHQSQERGLPGTVAMDLLTQRGPTSGQRGPALDLMAPFDPRLNAHSREAQGAIRSPCTFQQPAAKSSASWVPLLAHTMSAEPRFSNLAAFEGAHQASRHSLHSWQMRLIESPLLGAHTSGWPMNVRSLILRDAA